MRSRFAGRCDCNFAAGAIVLTRDGAIELAQVGAIVFHELAEAHAKLEVGLDYLDQGLRPGAHTQALLREQRLKAQRPDDDIVVTTGSNRLLRTQEEIRLFTAEAIAGVNQR